MRRAPSSTIIVTSAPGYSRTEHDRKYEDWMTRTHFSKLHDVDVLFVIKEQ
jgi:hypothetical protein